VREWGSGGRTVNRDFRRAAPVGSWVAARLRLRDVVVIVVTFSLLRTRTYLWLCHVTATIDAPVVARHGRRRPRRLVHHVFSRAYRPKRPSFKRSKRVRFREPISTVLESDKTLEHGRLPRLWFTTYMETRRYYVIRCRRCICTGLSTTVTHRYELISRWNETAVT